MRFDSCLDRDEFKRLNMCCHYVSNSLKVHGYVRECEIITFHDPVNHQILIYINTYNTERIHYHQIEGYVLNYFRNIFNLSTNFSLNL